MDKMKKKQLFLRIAVPVLIGVVMTVVWIVKTHPTPTPIDEQKGGIADFTLAASSIDLEALTAHGLPIIIDFGSVTCIPCQQMAPVLEAVNEAMQGKAIIKFVDLSRYPEVADAFPVQVIPTQIFIRADGKPYVPMNDVGVEFTLYSYQENKEHIFTAHQGGLTEKQMLAILKDMGVEE